MQRADEAVELVLGAVVGVQRDVDGVLRRPRRARTRPARRRRSTMSLIGWPEAYSAPPVETWMMPSLLGLGEAADRGVRRSATR